MKPSKYNKKMNKENISILSRPFSVNTYHQRRDNTFQSPLNKKNNYSFYNKYIYTNNYNNIAKLNVKRKQKLLEFKPNEIINEREDINNKPNYDNLSVKIFNLYNIKDKNEPFAIRINNNSPKYYINNCVNQLLFKKLSPENRIRNNENFINNKNINNKDNNCINNINNKYILSLVSPKSKNYKKIVLNKNNTNNNIINIKKCNNEKIINNNIKEINNIQLSNQNNQGRINLNKYSNHSYSNIYKINPKNIYNNNISIPEEKNLDVINNSNMEIFSKRFKNSELILKNENIKIKTIMNKNRMNFYNNRIKETNLTLEIPERKSFNKNFSPKINNINNNKQNKSFFNLSKNESNNNTYLFSDNKRNIKKLKNTKNKNRVVNSIFDLKNNKFESKTLNEIIQEFNEKEEKDFNKIETINNKNNNNNKIKHKIPYQKIKKKKIITNDDGIIKLPNNMKNPRKNNFDIYLQYNQKNDVEKILLNDKNGKITSFIPMKNKDKFNTIDKTTNNGLHNIIDI